jgi:dTDP-4-dehydrorhamnose reductase
MAIAVTGAEGQLGSELCRQFGAAAVGFSRRQLDLTDCDAVRRTLLELRPSAVINAAAFTQVDRAESERELCWRVNATAVATLAEVCRLLDSTLVQVSTDYVFGADGGRSTPYREEDPPGPISVYGESKLEGERFAAACPRHFVVRTSGLFGVAGEGRRPHNFIETMLRLAVASSSSVPTMRVVTDQITVPSNTRDIAAAIRFLVSTRAYGLYHVVNRGAATWHEFATEIFRYSGMTVAMAPVTSQEFAAPARRPAYSVLNTLRYESLGGPPLRTWQEGLAEYLNSLRGSQ